MPGLGIDNKDLGELEEQIDSLKQEMQDLKSALQGEAETSERQRLEEAIQAKEQTLIYLEGELEEADEETQGLRRSSRRRNPTEKMHALQTEVAEKKVKGLLCMYDQWKILVRTARNQLKSDIPESELGLLIDTLVKTSRVEAAAELAAKEAEYEMQFEEQKQKCVLERLQAEREVRAARARLEVYNQATKREDSNTEKRNTRETKRDKASVFSTQIATDSEKQGLAKKSPKPPCVLCQDSRHQLHGCSKFMAMSLEERRKYIKEKRLCYGCLKPGHGVKDCRYRHICTASLCHRVTIKELPPITPAQAIRILESDFKNSGVDSKMVSQDDIVFLNMMNEGIHKNSQGHYEMPLPFKKRPSLPDNKQLATVRLNHLKRKLLKDGRHKEHYVKFMNEVIERGDTEEIKDHGIEGERWYIPHHGVYHNKKSDKLRVVFDCSAKYQETSLNDHLLSGPDLTNNLTGVLIRFRQYPVALTCDIERMFHQFHVNENDRNYLRFLWWKGGDLNTQPEEFRMKVHLFGAASSPGCANYGMKQLAKENRDLYPLGSQFVMKNFYVDDGVTSVKSTEDAIQLAREAQELCTRGGLRLHKFVSNDRAVLESIQPSERGADVKNLDLSFDDLPLERALGIQWDIESDCFRLQVNLKIQPETRRGILSTVASLYDPLGFVAPFLLKGKGILQDMCRRGIGWDDPLTDELQPQWERWRSDLVNLDKITIPRCYAPADFGKIIKTELHHFSDASTKGYGQCTYLRLQNKEGDVHCALVIGKSRVSPTKITTIPRLELSAAVVSVKISDMLKEELGFPDAKEVFWTDSKVVLGYINNEARRFHTFVANRLQKIHLTTTPHQWKYVPTDENPADHASRGLTASELSSSIWFTGPQFLWKKEIVLPEDGIPELTIGDPEVRSAQALKTKTTEQVSIVDRLSKLSSWSRATRAIARILRRISKNRSNCLTTVTERENAERVIIRSLQEQVYEDELQLIRKGVPLPSHNELYRLDAFLDEDGVLKVGGRLCNSSLSNLLKHPAIIPKHHHISKMIIACCHENVKHQGKGLTINEIRSNGYWIPGINRAVATHIRQCMSCRRHRKPTEEQRMADLPPERVDPSPPFTYCGMDCFGPFLVRQGRKVNKRLDDASLRAFLYEAMAIVNSRPLTTDNLNDPNSLDPLTPNHLLTMKSIRALPPPGAFVREDMYARKRWRHVQYLAEQFWSRWRREYLANIAIRQRWHTSRRNLQIGDIVMVRDDNLPRNEWRFGRVSETTADKDGLVRRVQVCLGDRKLGKKGERVHKLSVIERPVQKLVLLLETS
ncbi:hypothetical protein SKAU_G00095210 [Synaphobranchus kaupii]|uniref:CCHC-type domain-containing protein n=1 Tax=Synaphobranchus kaupii TaxID=118154 RepID=A0A9Q1FYB2_SYNKA|nr:hypothetical protein SKAU_G00095210 [Synaphobranchus kaupii]